VGPDGVKGIDGRDGTLEQVHVRQSEDFRTVTFCYADGTPVPGTPLYFPVPIFQGTHELKTYDRGDVVTYDGSWWIAREATDAVPGIGATPWQLCVKQGRRGKDGKDGIDGKDGKDGVNGRDRWRP
jgi:hypothetical protein